VAVDQLYNVPETVAPTHTHAADAGAAPAAAAAPASGPAGFFAAFTRLFTGGGGAATSTVTLYKVVYSVFPTGKFYKGGATGAGAGAAAAPAGSPKKGDATSQEAVRFTEFNDLQVRLLSIPRSSGPLSVLI